jgi:hypothetical protein
LRISPLIFSGLVAGTVRSRVASRGLDGLLGSFPALGCKGLETASFRLVLPLKILFIVRDALYEFVSWWRDIQLDSNMVAPKKRGLAENLIRYSLMYML